MRIFFTLKNTQKQKITIFTTSNYVSNALHIGTSTIILVEEYVVSDQKLYRNLQCVYQ